MEYIAEYDNAEVIIDIRDMEDMVVISEHRTVFYAERDNAVKVALFCTVVTALFYAVARIQGRIRTSVHGGLHLFWSALVVGELSVCAISLLVAIYTYVRDSGHASTLICADFSPLTKYCAYGWLLLWVVFVVAVLRGTVAITWLNRIRDPERLADMTRGIGILCLSLIYLFPLALLNRYNADKMSSAYEPFTVCVPSFDHGVDVSILQMLICVSWIVAVVFAALASGRFSDATRTSRLAIPLVLASHFIPTMVFFIWLTNSVELGKFRDSVPAMYACITALSAFCNFFTYKLFPLATKDAEIPVENIQSCRRTIFEHKNYVTEDKEMLHGFIDPPPAYVEKIQVV